MKRLVVILLASCAIFQPPPTSRPSTGGPRHGTVHHDPRFDKSAADLDSLVATETLGYAADGDALTGSLETFAPQSLRLTRGKCYRMVLRLGEGSSFSEHAHRGVSFIYTGFAGTDEVVGGPGITGPGGVGGAGCPQRDTSAMFDLRAPAAGGSVHDLGRGSYTLQLFSKPISDAELAKLASDDARDRAADAERSRARKGESCGNCRHDKDLCLDGRRRPSTGSCTDDFDSCRFSSGLSEKDCN